MEKTAKALSSMGIASGDIVTIMSMHTPETIQVIYALNYLGAVANNVYPTLNENELEQTISNTDSKAFFILDAILEKNHEVLRKLSIPVIILGVSESMPILTKWGYGLKNQGRKDAMPCLARIVSYRDFLREGSHIEDISPAADSAAPACIVYTSGTTGDPKGVVINSDSINNLAIQDMNGLVKIARGKTLLFILPPFIGFGMTHMHIYMSAGITLILQIVLDPKVIVTQLFKHKPYAFISGPAFIPEFNCHKPRDLSNLKYFISGGGSLTEEQILEANSLLAKCGSTVTYSNGYGMTEACSSLSVNVNPKQKIESVGLPWVDTIVKIVDPDSMKELKYGEVGELWFNTTNFMLGYYHDQKATDEVIVTDDNGMKWLRTGDLGTVDEDGYIFIKGRIKRIYITRCSDGVVGKLFPAHIENVLLSVQEVENCGVVVSADEERMNVATAFVSLKDSDETADIKKDEILDKLRKLAKSELSEHEVPVAIHLVEKMPMTPSGKIDYRELEKRCTTKF